MRKSVGIAIGAAVLTACGALSVHAEQAQRAVPPRSGTAAAVLPNTQALFDGYVAQDRMPGIVGGFGAGDLPTLFVSAGKIGDGPQAAAAGPDSLWRVYSMTKPITGMAAMILVEEGKLKLDQPISDFLPAFRTMTVQDAPDTLASHPATRPITVRNLLTHTAGLGYNIITKGPLLKAYDANGINPAQVNAQLEPAMRRVRAPSLQEFANRAAKLPLIAEPGTKWSYSIGLDVLGAVIEKASGQPFDAFVQARIFTPLKMTSSYWQVPAGEARRLADNVTWGIGGRRVPLDPGASSVYLQKPSFPYGGAGLVMSARDYDRFLHMLQDYGTLDGVQIMKPETARLAMSNLLPPGVVFSMAGVSTTGGTANASPAQGFGAGGSVYLRDVPGGASAGTYGWGGAAGTIAWVDPKKRARGTVMVNYFPGERYPVRAETVKALYADLQRLGQ